MPTIGGSVVLNAQRVPDREALVAGDRRWTWGQLDAQVGLVAGRLRACGVRRGDRVAIVAANTAEHVMTSYAVSRLAAIVVPVNTRLAPPEVRHILADAAPTVVAVGPSQVDLVGSALSDQLDGRPSLVSIGGGPHRDVFADATQAEAVTTDEATEADDCVIVYTSGTTGKPKGVLHDHHRAVWAAMAQVACMGMRDGERYLHLSPLYHSGGVVYLNAVALLGGTNIMLPAFDPELLLETVERERATMFLGVPTMYQLLLQHHAPGKRDLSSWRLGVFGAAPMPASTIKALMARFPKVAFIQQCGQTEAGPTGLYSTTEQVRAQPHSSGHQAQPFVQAKVVDRDGRPVARGEVGELCFRSEAVMKGYWNDPEATATAIRGGWLHTGDLVYRREDAGLTLVDRLKDVIIAGGQNVYSAEVEQAIAQHPDVVDCAVVGRPHHVWGSTVIAVVEMRQGATMGLDELRAHCAPLIADYKTPREIVLGPVPRNGAGKVQKHLLRARLFGS